MFSKSASLLAILSVFLLVPAAWAETKIGTVDVNRVFKEYHKTKDAMAKVNDAKSAAEKEFGERSDAYKKALDEINRLNTQLEAPALSAEAKAGKAKERDEKIAELKNMEHEINDFRQTREHELQEELQRFHADILQDVMKVVLAEVKSRNLDLVFDTSGASLNQFSPILFARASDDFTSAVIAELNKMSRSTPAPKP